MALNNTIIQTVAPAEMRGRVMSIYMMTWGLMPFSVLPAGAIAQAVGTPLTLGVGGAILVIFAIAMGVLHPTLRRL